MRSSYWRTLYYNPFGKRILPYVRSYSTKMRHTLFLINNAPLVTNFISVTLFAPQIKDSLIISHNATNTYRNYSSQHESRLTKRIHARESGKQSLQSDADVDARFRNWNYLRDYKGVSWLRKLNELYLPPVISNKLFHLYRGEKGRKHHKEHEIRCSGIVPRAPIFRALENDNATFPRLNATRH